ncbi:MAG: hypothetical protein V4568_00675 [Pseudomonadota bacterium]
MAAKHLGKIDEDKNFEPALNKLALDQDQPKRPPNINIRDAVPEHAQVMADLQIINMSKWAMSDKAREELLDATARANRFRKVLSEGGNTHYRVAELPDLGMVGFCISTYPDADSSEKEKDAELRGMQVSRQHQHKNVGSVLENEVWNEAHRRGSASVILCTPTHDGRNR